MFLGASFLLKGFLMVAALLVYTIIFHVVAKNHYEYFDKSLLNADIR